MIGREPKAPVGGVRQNQRSTLSGVQPGQGLFRQNDPNGISDFAQFEFEDHRESGYGRNNAAFSRKVKVNWQSSGKARPDRQKNIGGRNPEKRDPSTLSSEE
jgi:hypothetical protein